MSAKEHFEKYYPFSVKNGGDMTWEEFCKIRKQEIESVRELIEKLVIKAP